MPRKLRRWGRVPPNHNDDAAWFDGTEFNGGETMAITYQIIVAKSRVLSFETSQTRIKTLAEAKKAYDLLRAKFPTSEGYSVTPCEWKNDRRTMSPSELTGPVPPPPVNGPNPLPDVPDPVP